MLTASHRIGALALLALLSLALIGAAPKPTPFEDALLELMLEFKMPKGSEEEKLSDEAKLERWRPLVEKTYAECKRYEPRTKVKAETCAAISINAAYWETGLQLKYQLAPKVGPSGEECYFQIHRFAEQIPFDEWKPLHEYGTRHGPDVTRCVEDGVRILSYHPWRCHLDETDLRGTDNRMQIFRLYVQYYKPSPECGLRLTSLSKLEYSLLRRRASMARRILKRLPAEDFR